MGELGDYLLELKPAGSYASGMSAPGLDSGIALRPVRVINLREWRRFCGTLSGWSVLQPDANGGSV